MEQDPRLFPIPARTSEGPLLALSSNLCLGIPLGCVSLTGICHLWGGVPDSIQAGLLHLLT